MIMKDDDSHWDRRPAGRNWNDLARCCCWEWAFGGWPEWRAAPCLNGVQWGTFQERMWHHELFACGHPAVAIIKM